MADKLSDLNMTSPSRSGSQSGQADLGSTLNAETLRAQMEAAKRISSSPAPTQKHPYLNAILGIVANAVDPEITGAAFNAATQAHAEPAIAQHNAAVEEANKYIEGRKELGANLRMIAQAQPHILAESGLSAETMGELLAPGSNVAMEFSGKDKQARWSETKKQRVDFFQGMYDTAEKDKNPVARQFFGTLLAQESFTPDEIKEIQPGLQMLYNGDTPQFADWAIENFPGGLRMAQNFYDTGQINLRLGGTPFTPEEKAAMKGAGNPEGIATWNAVQKWSRAVQQARVNGETISEKMIAERDLTPLENQLVLKDLLEKTDRGLSESDYFRNAAYVDRQYEIANMVRDAKAMKDPEAAKSKLFEAITLQAAGQKSETEQLDFNSLVRQGYSFLAEMHPERYPDTPEGSELLDKHALYYAIQHHGSKDIPKEYKQYEAAAKAINLDTLQQKKP